MINLTLRIAAIGIVLASVGSPADASDEPTSEATAKVAEKKPLPTVGPIEGPTDEEIKASIKRGIDFLIADQNPNGSWGSATRTKDLNIFAPIPGAHHAFRAGTTGLALAALIELEPRYPEVTPAIEKAEKWMMTDLARLRRADPTAIYNVWGHGYSIQALTRMYGRSEDVERRDAIRKIIQQQIERLVAYESVDGGWGYYDFDIGANKPASKTTSFTTASVLVALHEAKSTGVEIPEKIVSRAIASIRRQQRPDYSYLYGYYLKNRPVASINSPSGSLGRSQACNIALRYWGAEDVTDEVVTTWLHRLFARQGWLDIGRKRPIPHESWAQVAGYFYYFGHYYGTLCIDALPAEQQELFIPHMAKTMLDRQEKDGSWWDYPLYDYHQPYGTGYALLTLNKLLRD